MTEPEELTRMHQTLNYHYPKTYLNAWAQGVRTEWAEFLDRVFLSDVPDQLGDGDGGSGVVLDMGSGPSICNIIAASRWSSHIYLAELLEGNRKEIQKFLDNADDVWNWQPYFDFQGILEINADTHSIEERVKNSVSGVIECNLATEEVFAKGVLNEEVDVLICSLVFDVVCTDPGNLELVITRALQCMAEDGLMIVQGSLGEERYCVGSAVFPVLNIDEETLRKVFENLSLEVVRWETTVRLSTHYFTVLKRK